MHEHPTQALLDLRTILAHLRPGMDAVNAETLAGVTVTIAGDILHSRVARSNMLLLPRLGARVLLCGPKELLPELAADAGPGIEIERDFDAAHARVAGGDDAAHSGRAAGRDCNWIWMSTRPAISSRVSGWRRTRPRRWCMHPGPIIRGMEITAGVADGVQSAILEQVTHGVAIRMAVMERALLTARKQEAAHDGAGDSRRAPDRSGGRRGWPAKDILLKDGRVAEIAASGKLKLRMEQRRWTRPDSRLRRD